MLLRQLNPDLPATTSIVNHSTGTRVFWMMWETLSMAAAGYVTARLAASSQVAHATVMGAIQAVVTLWAMFSVRSDEPLWFWLTGIALMVPAAWLGGRWRVRKSALSARAISVTRWPNVVAVAMGSSDRSPHGATISPQQAEAE